MIPESTTEYGTWTAANGSLVVEYSLPVFHEIDFVVSEAYRRIPHGGIEVGGLLFGYSEPRRVRIEMFRPIQCEHALGPSFKLSEADIAALRLQVGSAGTDPDLQDLRLLGWYISHTRSGLSINETELKLFNEIIPGAGKLTILIKPEKFKPTLFAFLGRGADGRVSLEEVEDPIILPLTGRGGSKATAEIGTTAEPASEVAKVQGSVAERIEPQPSAEDEGAAVRRALFAARQMSARDTPTPPMATPVRTPAARSERGEIAARNEVLPESRREPTGAPTLAERVPMPASVPWPDEMYEAGALSRGAPWSNREQRGRPPSEPTDRSKLQFTLVMLLSAALGCGLGYWAYLQLPPSVIPLDVRPEPYGLLLSWPPEQTRESNYAAIRVNDGEPVPLSAIAKAAGQSRIDLQGDNVKVEIIAQHWMRNSRGIVRFVTPERNMGAAIPAPVKARPRTRSPGSP